MQALWSQYPGGPDGPVLPEVPGRPGAPWVPGLPEGPWLPVRPSPGVPVCGQGGVMLFEIFMTVAPCSTSSL